MVESSKNSFSKTIKNFDPKDEKQTLELKKILNSYPYFQSVSAYLLKTLKIQEKESFNELLPRTCLLYTSPSPRDATLSRMPSSA